MREREGCVLQPAVLCCPPCWTQGLGCAVFLLPVVHQRLQLAGFPSPGVTAGADDAAMHMCDRAPDLHKTEAALSEVILEDPIGRWMPLPVSPAAAKRNSEPWPNTAFMPPQAGSNSPWWAFCPSWGEP